MKSRMSSLDIRAEVNNLQHLVGLRIANIYDLSQKLFIWKFSKPDHKVHLLLESGVRFHTTEFNREKPKAPTPFTSKLRKHLRTNRLVALEQLGIDRVVNFTFESGEETHHVIFEMYASGNLILTDSKYEILALLRSHKFEEDVKYGKGEIYPFEYAANLQFSGTIERITVEETIKNIFSDPEKVKKGINFKQLLSQLCPYMHFPFAEHCLKVAGFTSLNKKLSPDAIDIEMVIKAMTIGSEVVQKISSEEPQGYLIYKEKDGEKEYQEACPVVFSQYESLGVENQPTFDRALDIFFAVAEKQKVEQVQEKKEQDIWKKKNKIEKDQQRRLNDLRNEQVTSEKKAKLIEDHMEEIDGLFDIMVKCLETGIDWTSLWRMIVDERNRGNKYAAIVNKIKLDKKTVEVKFPDPDTDEEIIIELDIYKNAYQNAREYYGNKKVSKTKEIKTLDAMEEVLNQAEKKARAEQEKQGLKLGVGIRTMRKVFWWEKFNWFISSDNYIIVSGKDAQQNEMIVKKYMKKTDIYVHADIHGAASTVIKNPSGLAIPVRTLEEAGTFCVCLSNAWATKVIQAAWWVYAEQVSKTAPSGLYLSAGSFMIRGKKNFLHPSKLEMSIVLLFKLGDDSLARHLGERKVKEEENGELPQLETVKSSVSQSEEDLNSEFVIDTGTVKVKQKPKPQEKKPQEKKSKETDKPEVKQKNKAPSKYQLKKLKKIKEKYGEQTEEERRIKLALIGSKDLELPENYQQEKKEVVTKEEVKEEEEEESSDEEEEEEEKVEEEKAKEVEAEEVKVEEQKIEEKVQQPSKREKAKKDREEIKQILEEENLLNEDEMLALGEADTLTGNPLPEDTLLYCIPMCAPHNATGTYKYRIKLMPGSLKKGKAVNMITFTWLNLENITDTEKQLIKSMSETEITTVLLGKCTIATPGAQKLQKQFDKKPKAKAKPSE
ncbi:unnamed protein product [Blepharisma stoltei]|uniref:Uncharacterized protein n=1 Tax=Blepharisma stoltei TaxID=1481888 RepID=A0AAU9KAQ8_9CILI|nr:unnamed protein product [Blepharisma stoltei]